ncbi:MAG TPA: hypothetical protein PK277_09155 [Methanoregulaceae archaeon]|nr:hypothetical protein [Methanoregulaceae archaeon]
MSEKTSGDNNSNTSSEKTENIIQLKSSKDDLKVKVTASVSLQMMSKHSDKHYRCACLCTQSCVEIEGTYHKGEDEKIQSEKYQKDQALATGSIMSIVAYLETTINEFFSDCITKSGNFPNFSKIDESIIENLVNYWNQTDNRGIYKNRWKTILERYLDVYKIIKGKGLHYPSKYYEDVNALIDLRNILVHYEPKWQHGKPHFDDPYGINRLDGKFSYNKFREDSGNPFFPYKCLGAGCSKWAIVISENFVKEFFSNIDVDPVFFKVEEIRKEILGS